MGQYKQKKMEYFKGSSAILRFYQIWITFFTLFSVVMLTWKITTSGYEEPIYFLLDFLVCGLSIIALLSFIGFDKYTVFANIAYLLAFLSAKIYRTLHYMGVFGGLPSPDLGAVEAMMDPMTMGMGMDMSMAGGAATEAMKLPVSPDIGIIGQLIQKFLSGPLKVAGDFSKFIVVLECELFVVLCIMFILFFINNWKFFKTPLAQLREKES